jgi:hypothetical protein
LVTCPLEPERQRTANARSSSPRHYLVSSLVAAVTRLLLLMLFLTVLQKLVGE